MYDATDLESNSRRHGAASLLERARGEGQKGRSGEEDWDNEMAHRNDVSQLDA